MKKLKLFLLGILPLFFVNCSKEVITQEDSSSNESLIYKSSSAGDVVGKLVVGYQGWFACAGDGSPRNSWTHWAPGSAPSPGNQTFELWPDIRDYARGFQTGYANLGNGQPAKLYSSYDNNVVDTHIEWMQQYGIDVAAVQRFGSELSNSTSKAQRDGIATKVRNAAQTFGRKFYIMYDISGWTNFQSEIKTDWLNTITGSLSLTSSGAYARQNGKPVVCVWGVGVSGRPGNVSSWTEVINWFKNQGCYVIIGVHRQWRSDSDLTAYNSANMISPWCVGSYKNITEVDAAKQRFIDDLAYCESRGIDFQPVVFPGFAWSNWNGGSRNLIPRVHGDFMWRQFCNFKSIGITNIYVAMFDEYDEATAIAKAAENSSMIPTNQYFLTLDADGVAVSSDFYLRLTNDGARMMKGEIPLVWSHPTPHILSAEQLLSQGRNASASSFQSGNLVSYGNDGNTSSRWAASGPAFPQWWSVDLGSNKNISGVAINWYNSANRAYGYKIEVSNNGSDFNTVIDKTSNIAFGDTNDTFSANGRRYVRITVNNCTNSGGYASFSECKIYGN